VAATLALRPGLSLHDSDLGSNCAGESAAEKRVTSRDRKRIVDLEKWNVASKRLLFPIATGSL